MANYNYGGYPYGMPYQAFMPQPNQQPNYNNMNNNYVNQQPQQQPQANNYFYVNGVVGAKSFQLQPNQTVMLMDSDNPMCYMKQSNGMGQSTLRYFKLVEVSESELNTTSEAKQNNNEYVLKTDFDVLNKKVNDLLDKLEKPKENENK